MFPAMKQKLLILAGLAVCGACWAAIAGALSAADGSSGITLSSASVGWAGAVGLMLLAGLPTVLWGTFAGAGSNPLAGVFVAGTSLAVLAGLGGSSRGFLWRTALPGGYGMLVVDVLIWAGWYALLLWAIEALGPPLRRRMPVLRSPGEQSPLVGWEGWPVTLVGGLITAGLGALLVHVMVRTVETGQIIGSLILAFFVAGAVGRMIVPGARAVGMLATPLAVGLASYIGYAVFSGYGSHQQVLSAWYEGRLSGLAWVLPIHYASAGVLGVSLGLGVAQSMLREEPPEDETDDTDEQPVAS